MTRPRLISALLGATALGFAFAAPVSAQTTEADACAALTQLIEDAGDSIGPDFADAAEVAKAGDGTACLLYVDRVEAAGGLAATAPAEGGGATAEQQAGQGQQATTGQGAAQGDTAQPPATGQGTAQQDTAQQTTTGQGAAQQGTVRQGTAQQATTGEGATAQQDTAKQPATEQQDSAQQSTTGQAAPAQQNTAQETTTEQETTEQGDTAQGTTTEQGATGDTAQGTTIGTTTGQDAAQQGATEQAGQGEAAQQETTAAAEAEPEAGAEVAVADITGRDVLTAEGEEVGDIDRILVIDGEPHAIFQRGGFFGIGSDDVAVPAAQLEMRGEELILTGVGAGEFEAMPEFEAETETALAAEDTVRIGAAE